MILINKKYRIIEIFELQGEAENVSKFDGIFNKHKVELEFDKYILKGRKVDKKLCILENDDNNLTVISKQVDYYIFDKPPRYKL